MNEPAESWQELADAAMTRLLAWDLTHREKLVAGWVVEKREERQQEERHQLQQVEKRQHQQLL